MILRMLPTNPTPAVTRVKTPDTKYFSWENEANSEVDGKPHWFSMVAENIFSRNI